MKIAERPIDTHNPPYVVAELSCNHAGAIKLAQDTIIAAADCGADAVKIQCYEADEMAFDGDLVVEHGPWAGKRLYDLYKEAETPYKMVRELFSFAKKNKITLFASVFSPKGVDLMVELGSPAIKIASFELTDTPLIGYAASHNVPMIISTGCSVNAEVIRAIHTYNKSSIGGIGRNLALLHCVSDYPADPRDIDITKLGVLSELVGGRHVVGFSDHTLGIGSAVSAVACGASILEKHVILDRGLGGPDAGFSMEPADFSLYVRTVREAWQAIQPLMGCRAKSSMAAYRRAVWVVSDVKAGDLLDQSHVRILRGGRGVEPSLWSWVLGKRAAQSIPAGTPLLSSMVVASDQSSVCNPDLPQSSAESSA